MKFTLNWLKEYLETDASLEQITETLTAIGLEVEEVVDKSAALSAFRVAQIVDAKPHPDADKLRVCRVNTGAEELQIVCGAPNARAGINVVLAPIGTIIPTNGMKIKPAKIRGVESSGMMCSAAELGLGEDHNGIIELPACNDNLGKKFVEEAGLNDPMIEIAITPNRGDCLGVYGIARDLAAAGLGKLKPLKVEAVKESFDSEMNVKLEDKELCQLFFGRYFKNVKNGESPAWLKQRLEAIGLRPISVLVDITNYIAFTFGRPLHVYDAKKLKGDLVVRQAKAKEDFKALDEKAYQLPEGLPVVADDVAVHALGGVIGGLDSGCDENTTDVFLEVALFDADAVAKAGRAMEIQTDSRYRFERRVDPAFLETATAIASQMIVELCGAEASKPVRVGKEPVWQNSINFEAEDVARIGGVELSKSECERILKTLGFDIDGKKVAVPSWRPDVEGVADLVEEVLRIHGYDNIPTTPLPQAEKTSEPSVAPQQSRVSKARRLLVSRGMMEAITWSFMPSDLAKAFGHKDDGLLLQNPISSELDCMRPSMIPNLLQAVSRNAARGVSDLALFEIGPVFFEAKPGGETRHISGVRSGAVIARNVHGAARNADLFDVKADALAALESMGAPVANLQVSADAPSWYHPGRSGVLKLGKSVLAVFGEIHPAILKQLDVKTSVAAFEVFADNLPDVKKKGKSRSKLTISDYQSSTRDFAFIVDADVEAESMLRAARNADKQLIKDATLFDIYQGKGVEDGKKSVALSVLIQPSDRTLTDKELEAVQQKVIDAVGKQTGAVLRG